MIEEEIDEIRSEHQDFKMGIEKRVNSALWWAVSILATGLVGLLFAVIRAKIS